MGGSVFMSTTPTRFVRQRSNARYAGTCANSFVRARSRRWRDESSNCLFFVRHVIIVLIFIKYVMDRDGTNRVRVRTAPSIRVAFESRLAKKFDGRTTPCTIVPGDGGSKSAHLSRVSITMTRRRRTCRRTSYHSSRRHLAKFTGFSRC